jgi:chorismate synthase
VKNTFGQSISVTLFGESHGAAIGAVIDGLASGIKVDEGFIAHQLTLRRPSGAISTARREADEYSILSGVWNGYTTGTPLCITIPNADTRSNDYQRGAARPSHADLAAYCKYHGFEDYRGGGHFSGRITAALVAAAGVVIPALNAKGIYIGTHIKRLGGVADRELCDIENDLRSLADMDFPVLDKGAEEDMKNAILAAASDGDSVGGVLETAVVGIPSGVGEPWFDSVESLISHAVFSVPAVKGIEFGAGFGFADMRGSAANDAWRMKDGTPVTLTNNNGGVNGGITNGMPIIFRTAVKPTPSIAREQLTVNAETMEETTLTIRGRHDPCIVHRARVVVDSVTALVIADMLAQRFGTDYLAEGAK